MNRLPESLEATLKKAVLKTDLAPHYPAIRRAARLTFLLRVALAKNPKRLPLGCSHLGGTPDLPPKWKWPVADDSKSYGSEDRQLMGFIGQINFAEIPQIGQALPKTGIAYFFACVNEQDEYVYKVIYTKVSADRLIRHAPPVQTLYADEYEFTFGTLRVRRFVPSVSLPNSRKRMPKLPDELYDAYTALAGNLHRDPKQHEPSSRLLGHPFTVYDDVLPDDGWQLLLEAQSYFTPEGCQMNFGDAGSLQYISPTAQLKNGKFDAVRAFDFSN